MRGAFEGIVGFKKVVGLRVFYVHVGRCPVLSMQVRVQLLHVLYVASFMQILHAEAGPAL